MACVCGGGGSSKKETARADDLARQERERAEREAAALRDQQAQAAAQLQAQQAEADRQLQSRIAQTVQPTDLETERIGRIQQLEPDLQRILSELITREAPTPGMGGELGQLLQQRFQQDLLQPREIPFEDTFEPQMKLLREQVRADAASRGLVGSGLELENMGRAGIDLAVQQAQARQQNRQANEQLRQQSILNAFTGQQQGVEESRLADEYGRLNRGEAQGFLQNMQALEDARRGRQVQAQTGGAQTGAGIVSQGNLAGADLAQAGNLGASSRLLQGNQNALAINQMMLQSQMGQRAAQQQAIGNLVGTVAPIALGAAGGAVFGPLAGASSAGSGAAAGASLLGSGTLPSSPLNINFAGLPAGASQVPTGSNLRAQKKTNLSGGYADAFNYLG